MSAFAMKPTFKDMEGWLRWRAEWRSLYKKLSMDIRKDKQKTKLAQRTGETSFQKRLGYQRAMAFKMMGLLQEGKDRRDRLLTMKKQLAEQMASFPMTIEDCKTIDFHFNKGSLEYPELPTWVVKTKGKSYYVHHMTAECPWSTRELPEGSTKGMLRFKNCNLFIDANGEARISN